MSLGLLIAMILAGLSVLSHHFGLLLTGGFLVLQAGMIFVRIAAEICKPVGAKRQPTNHPAVFSVHVAIHNEPPLMVQQTLRGLLAQDWPADGYEIIVIDNNTSDPAVWRPVADFCDASGGNIHFLHRMNVMGAKAGALNIALAATRADVTHIVTVDADYRVTPDFLSHANRALAHTGADYIQFPQAYTHSAQLAPGVDAELEEYFRSTAQLADGAEAVLLTGTLCVVSKPALETIGGWSTATTTEDADTGVRLCQAGYVGRFISHVVGEGLLPLSLRDLEKQRYRWASGNLQTLRSHMSIITDRTSALSRAKRFAVLSQLTAWLNLSLLPAAIMILSLLTGRSNQAVVMLSAGTILLSLYDLSWRLIYRGCLDGLSTRHIASALASRLALAPTAARATVDMLLGLRKGFEVTDKSGASGRKLARDLSLHHVLPACAALVVLPAALHLGPLITAATLALALPLPSAIVTACDLQSYRRTLRRTFQENAT